MIPAPLEHQPSAVPQSREEAMANRVLHNAGWLRRFYLLGEKLYADIDICNKQVADNLPAIKFVSPEIRPEWEADGRKWKNVVTHVALTTQPVHRDQEAFDAPPVSEAGVPEPLAASTALSLNPIRLSAADAVTESNWLVRPYRVPEGGIWFRGKHYASGSVPKAEVASAEPEELHQFLRQLSARQKRVAPRAYASLAGSASLAGGLPPEAVEIPSASVASGSVKPLFTAHPDGHPALVWVDPSDGTTHLVSGSVPADGPASVIALAAPDREFARGEAARHLAKLGKVDGRDLAVAFKYGGAEAPHMEPGEVEAARASSSIPDESFSGYLEGRLTPAEAAAIGGYRPETNQFSLEGDVMAGFMADLEKEGEEEAKADKAEEKAEAAEGEADEGAAEEADEAVAAGPQDAELKDAVKLLRDLNVDLRSDEIANAKDLVHHLVIALHAIKKVAGGEAEEDMNKEALEPVSPTTPAVSAPATQMSIDDSPKFKAVLDHGTRSEFQKICATAIDPMVAEGRCTKAQADAIKAKIESCRLSLFDDEDKWPAQLVAAKEAIKTLKQNPAGTFGGAEKPAVQMSVSDAPENVLESVKNPTPTTSAQAGEVSEERIKEIKEELWKNMSFANFKAS